MAGIDDEAVMQSRLLNGVNVGGRPAPLRHLTKRFHEFVAACESAGSAGHAEDLHAALMREVGACELHLLIWRLKLRKLDRESEERDVEGSYAGVGTRWDGWGLRFVTNRKRKQVLQTAPPPKQVYEILFAML